MITLERLIACGVGPSTARAFEAPLQLACTQFNIATVPQQAAFIAQAMHESDKFTHLEESLYYSTPANIGNAFKRLRTLTQAQLTALCRNPKALAQAAYSNVNGNGGPDTMNGWDYRGGGPFQLTGLANYMRCGNYLGRPFEKQPNLIRVPGTDAALSAAWFWHDIGGNDLLAKSGFDAVSRRINGGINGLKERRDLFTACSAAFS